MGRSRSPDWLDRIAETTRTLNAVHIAESTDAPERVKRRAYRQNLNAMRRVMDAMSPPGKRPKGIDMRIDPRTGLPRFMLK